MSDTGPNPDHDTGSDNASETDGHLQHKASSKTVIKKENSPQIDQESLNDLHTGCCFSCSDCGKVFSTPWRLSVHVRTHTGERPFLCALCGKDYGDAAHLKRHIRQHGDERPHQCTECNKSFREGYDLTNHMRVHTGERPYLCSQCGKSFGSSSTLSDHMRTHQKPRKHKCARKKGQQRPLKPNGRSPRTRDHKCTECDKAFVSEGRLMHHLSTHSGVLPFECHKCGERYSKSVELTEHFKTHGERQFVCETCGKGFHRLYLLTRHNLVHTGEFIYSCSVCDKGFNLKDSFKAHSLLHSGEKPFVCDQCGKGYYKSTHLTRHKLTHMEGSYRFQCTECSKTFMQKSDLKLHVMTHSGEKPFSCTQCEYKSNCSSNLKKHMRVHSGDKTLRKPRTKAHAATQPRLQQKRHQQPQKQQQLQQQPVLMERHMTGSLTCTSCGKPYNQASSCYNEAYTGRCSDCHKSFLNTMSDQDDYQSEDVLEDNSPASDVPVFNVNNTGVPHTDNSPASDVPVLSENTVRPHTDNSHTDIVALLNKHCRDLTVMISQGGVGSELIKQVEAMRQELVQRLDMQKTQLAELQKQAQVLETEKLSRTIGNNGAGPAQSGASSSFDIYLEGLQKGFY